MSRESVIIVLGIVVFFTQYLGIPDNWKSYIFTGSGILLMLLGYFLRRAAYLRSIEKSNGERVTDSFMESTVKKQTESTDEL